MVTSNWSSEGAWPMVFITEPNSYNDDISSLRDQTSYSCLGGDCSISVSVKQAEGVPHLVHLGGRKPGVHVVPPWRLVGWWLVGDGRLTRSERQRYFQHWTRQVVFLGKP